MTEQERYDEMELSKEGRLRPFVYYSFSHFVLNLVFDYSLLMKDYIIIPKKEYRKFQKMWQGDPVVRGVLKELKRYDVKKLISNKKQKI